MKRFLSILFYFLLIFGIGETSAQEVSYGFRVGLNFATFKGPLETDDDGNDLEAFENSTGFHVGADIYVKFTELVGLKTGLIFYQRGGEYRFDGEGHQFLIADDGSRLRAQGNKNIILSVNNSYLDVPITAYYKIGEKQKFEIFGGMQLSFLVASTGSGDLSFNGRSVLGNVPVEFESRLLSHNYFKDDVPNIEDLRDAVGSTPLMVDGKTVSLPEALGAYYEFTEKDKSVFNVFDIGLHGGVAFYLNRGLYISAAVNYGLLDATNKTYDVSRTTTEGDDFIQRDDVDHNLIIQTSVGFSF